MVDSMKNVKCFAEYAECFWEADLFIREFTVSMEIDKEKEIVLLLKMLLRYQQCCYEIYTLISS